MSFQRFLPSFQRTQILGVQYSDVDCISKKGVLQKPIQINFGGGGRNISLSAFKGPAFKFRQKGR